MDIVTDQVRREASKLLDAKRRSELGQFMTPSVIASFMASLFTSFKGPVRLLDAGAGIGSLTSAFLDRALQNGIAVEAETWEIDETLRGFLQGTLDRYTQRETGAIKTIIHASDFIEDATLALQLGYGNRYTHAILNPPYKKICSNSKHRKLLRMAGIETVNLYTGFVALAALLMENGGEIVAIIPRSFCNGSYYRPFRDLVLGTCAIRQIHLFESRDRAFREDEVLQENIIIHLAKGDPQGRVTVSTSHDASFHDYREISFDASIIVKPDDAERYIHIPTVAEHAALPGVCSHSLSDIGLEVCTGPVVDFRLKDYWLDEPEEGSVPLIYPHHFSSGGLCWPKSHKKPNALRHSADIGKWLMPNGHYVLVRRFSAKEEPRRLVAYYLPHRALDAAQIGFENHWNVFHIKKQGMDENTARGLAAYLNSTVLDEYFRLFSGHTQVNATDLRKISYLSREQLKTLGQRAKGLSNDQKTIDSLLEELESQ